jgi:ATP-dependent Clp protease ATP-binding subunit ClpB
LQFAERRHRLTQRDEELIVALDPNRWTHKTQQAFTAAFEEARRASNPEVTVDHVVAQVLRVDGSIAIPMLQKAGLDDLAVRNGADEAVAKLPNAYGGSEPRLARDVSKAFDEADKARKELKDEYLSIEHLLLALHQRLGVSREQLLSAMRDVRGSHRITTQDPEDSYRALEKYSRDLTKAARDGKIDPVIGRDEEIRRVIQVLSRRSKNNPVLIGEPGVGKTCPRASPTSASCRSTSGRWWPAPSTAASSRSVSRRCSRRSPTRRGR